MIQFPSAMLKWIAEHRLHLSFVRIEANPHWQGDKQPPEIKHFRCIIGNPHGTMTVYHSCEGDPSLRAILEAMAFEIAVYDREAHRPQPLPARAVLNLLGEQRSKLQDLVGESGIADLITICNAHQ